MALIICPECHRPNVSDTAEVCPACGYGIKKHFEELRKIREAETRRAEKYQNELRRVKKPQKPKLEIGCLSFAILFTAVGLFVLFVIPENTDNIIGWIALVLAILMFSSMIYFYISARKEYKMECHLFTTNPDEYRRYAADKAMKNIKRVAEMREKIRKEEEKAKGDKCPKCGSTNIQMVRRNWSFVTGPMTNKVDRICVNCKTKF